MKDDDRGLIRRKSERRKKYEAVALNDVIEEPDAEEKEVVLIEVQSSKEVDLGVQKKSQPYFFDGMQSGSL